MYVRCFHLIVLCFCHDYRGNKAETDIQENNKWQVWSAANNLSVHLTICSCGPGNRYQQLWISTILSSTVSVLEISADVYSVQIGLWVHIISLTHTQSEWELGSLYLLCTMNKQWFLSCRHTDNKLTGLTNHWQLIHSSIIYWHMSVSTRFPVKSGVARWTLTTILIEIFLIVYQAKVQNIYWFKCSTSLRMCNISCLILCIWFI